jgi:hypothetical protein
MRDLSRNLLVNLINSTPEIDPFTGIRVPESNKEIVDRVTGRYL